MRFFTTNIYIFLLFALLFLSACSTTKRLNENQYLLRGNSIEVEAIDSIKDNRALQSATLNLALQEPNSRIFGLFPLRLWIYNLTYDTTKGINKFIRPRAGEPPVVYDSTMAVRSTDIMENFLFNKGYFNAEVTFDTEKKGKRAYVTYSVKKKGLSYVHEVIYDIQDERMHRLVYLNDPQIVVNDPYDVDDLLAERNRITKNFRNHGYYKFNKQYIYYEVDTLDNPDSVDIYVKIEPPEGDSVHHIYYINNIYLYPDYNREDSTQYTSDDTLRIDEYRIIGKHLRYNPKALLDAVFFAKGDQYKLDDHELTINRLTDLGVFRFVNIQFNEFVEEGVHKLDVAIFLLPSEKQSFNFTLEGYTNSDLLGAEAGVSYSNKNLFKYTDLFVLNLSGGVESKLTTSELNIIDFNADVNFYFPKFLLPMDIGKINRSFNPKTSISLSYNYFQRLEYFTLQNIAFSYGFDWKEFAPKRHIITFPMLNFVQVTNTTPAFEEKLGQSPILRKSFENQYILGGAYSFIYNNQGLTREDHAKYFRFNFESSGNILYLFNSVLGGSGSDSVFTIAGIPFSQYIKPDVEFRFYKYLSNASSVATRAFVGVGIPWGNSTVLPYIKQYVIGGANSIRAFRVRSVGPGGYSDPDTLQRFFIDQVGDIKLEGNIEYRFDISSIFEGALFLDAGNVWLLNEEPTKPRGNFDFTTFYRQLAVGTGFGLRLDFSFFILRLDLGIPVIDPGVSAIEGTPLDGNTFVLPHFFDSEYKEAYNKYFDRSFLNFNLAINYPF